MADTRPNHQKIEPGLYLVRTQAGFKRAAVDFAGDDKEGRWSVKFMEGHPKNYPSIVIFSYYYKGFHCLQADCMHVNEYRKRLNRLLEI